MSETHSPIATNLPQDYDGYQYRNVLQQQQHPGYPQQPGPFQHSNYFDAQHHPLPSRGASLVSSHPYASQPQQQTSINVAQSPRTSVIAQSPSTSVKAQRSSFPNAASPQGHYPTDSAYHAIMHGIQPPASVPPMSQLSASSQSAYPGSSSTRRPLPTPSAVPRPLTQPPQSRRPLPEPHASPSAPNTPFRHRPSTSVTANYSAAAVSTRPLPNPEARSTKSLDLKRSQSPVKDTFPFSGSQTSQWQHNFPHVLPELPERANGLSTTSSQLNRTPSAMRPLPSPRKPSTSPPASPVKAAGFARAISTEEGSRMRAGSPLRSRSRTLPHALPPPTGALPHRPDSVLAPPAYPHAAAGIVATRLRESPVSSESEDMYENSLLRFPQQQRSSKTALLERTPSPPPATQSRFIERSPERGPEQTRGNVAGAPPTRTRRLSLVSRMAEMSMAGSSGSAGASKHLPNTPTTSSPPKLVHPMAPLGRALTQPVQPRWPNELPPLPHAPQTQSESGERRVGSRQTSPVRHQPPQHPAQQQASPTRTHFSSIQRDPDSSERFPPPPSHPESPTRSGFRASHDSSSTRGQNQAYFSVPPSQSNPTSPSRARFPRQAPEREPALPAPRAQRVIPNLEDAPPPSLRRSPSPSPARMSGLPNEMTNRRSYHQAIHPLPSINTHTMASASKLKSPKFFSPPTRTPNSADSVFSVSAFPAPPQARQGSSSYAVSPGSRSMMSMIRDRNVSFPASPDDDDDAGYASTPSITMSSPNTPYTNPDSSPGGSVPQIAINGMDDDLGNTIQMPVISVGGPEETADPAAMRKAWQRDLGPLPAERSKGGLCCGGCGGPVIGRAVYTTDASWHPGCLKCTYCGQLLVDLAVCEHEGRPYCSLDYYENFAPRCHHCQTAIADPNYVTLKDEQLGSRTYHEQHFFCAECGDPFLPPSSQPRSFSGDGAFEADEGIKFIVHNFHAYCEACHVRLRMPKCKKCKKSLRNDDDQLEFLGAKYCPDCFSCTGCDGAFVNGQLFVRENKPFCRRCYDIIVKSEL